MASGSRKGIFCALALALAMLQAGCSRAAGDLGLPNAASTAKPTASLGELKRFRLIVADALHKVKAGDLVAARLRIKDLEIAWDEAEAGLKPRSAAQWHLVDSAIDQALAALRAEPPDARRCEQKLTDLLALFDAIQ